MSVEKVSAVVSAVRASSFACDAVALLFWLRNDGNGDRGENADDQDHDQKLDEGKTTLILTSAGAVDSTFGIPPDLFCWAPAPWSIAWLRSVPVTIPGSGAAGFATHLSDALPCTPVLALSGRPSTAEDKFKTTPELWTMCPKVHTNRARACRACRTTPIWGSRAEPRSATAGTRLPCAGARPGSPAGRAPRLFALWWRCPRGGPRAESPEPDPAAAASASWRSRQAACASALGWRTPLPAHHGQVTLCGLPPRLEIT